MLLEVVTRDVERCMACQRCTTHSCLSSAVSAAYKQTHTHKPCTHQRLTCQLNLFNILALTILQVKDYTRVACGVVFIALAQGWQTQSSNPATFSVLPGRKLFTRAPNLLTCDFLLRGAPSIAIEGTVGRLWACFF